MSDAKVEISIEEKNNSRWGIGAFFKQDGMKKTLNSKKFIAVLAAIFIFSNVIMLFQDSKSKSKPQKNVEVPQNIQSNGGSFSIQGIIDKVGRHDAQPKSASRSIKIGTFGPQVISRPRISIIPPGTFAKARLVTGASNNLVRAELIENLVVNNETVGPEGAILLGNGSSTDERLFIKFSKIIYKDGSSDAISAQACDFDDKIAGLKGSKISHQVAKMTGGIGLGFLGGLSEGLQDTEVQNGVVLTQPSLKNALLKGTATAALDQSRQLITELKDKQPIIEVKAGTEIYVIFSEVEHDH